MALVYYIQSGIATAVNDEPANPPLDPPWVSVSFAAYLTELINTFALANPAPYNLELLVSRSKFRTNPGKLHQAVLDTGKTVAIYLPDVPDFAYSQVEFYLDAVLVSTEASAPWDYGTTDGFGNATVVTIPAGTHTIDAVVTYPGGTFTVSADFEVN